MKSRHVLRLLALSGLLVVSFVASAAEDAVQAIARDVARPAVLRGEFSQEKQVAGFRNPLRSQGRFVVARERGVIWTTLKPFPSEMVITAERILSRQPDGSTRVELDAREQPAMRSVNAILFALMSGDVQALSGQFTVDAQRDAKGWTLSLTPRSPMLAKAFSALQLRGDRYVRQVDIVEASKDRTRLTFSALTEAPPTLAADEAARLD
ncbi:outer membrane lipoprotein carrier protein LolA [Stenotrophomonas sp. CFBP8980]|uniref:outer membrane lipoprotein carrier protein LolA n=1 Tax=Stenotrophomonas sp. CFBP8980 TaxID=3096523 RepID=UPI002A6AC320|nr:outer membrane lipoprotein carrier protein LolA [Stenotrophomonas sp. CFBP8980]MDY1034334.1 outer membrane lipoprotein carrier protein LolA [Stenotrophomonas sp. CFBP8980]